MFFAQKNKKFWEDELIKLPEKQQNVVEQNSEYADLDENYEMMKIKFLIKMKDESFYFYLKN